MEPIENKLFRARIFFKTHLIFPDQKSAQAYFGTQSHGTVKGALLAWNDQGLANYGFITAKGEPQIDEVIITLIDQIDYLE